MKDSTPLLIGGGLLALVAIYFLFIRKSTPTPVAAPAGSINPITGLLTSAGISAPVAQAAGTATTAGAGLISQAIQ